MNAPNTPLRWDPYDREMALHPYPVFRRLRAEQPLYYNEEHDFYALSRYADVEPGLKDFSTFSSSRGNILEIIKANQSLPVGIFINQDPPVHTVFRGLLQRIITPRRMHALEAQIRALCAQSLDPCVGSDRFDFITHLGADMPMRVIGMLLGIPEKDFDAVRKSVDDRLRTEVGKPMKFKMENFSGAAFSEFEEYITWRERHPSDDIMTELLTAEFKDTQGVTRKLTRDELVAIVNMVAGAGNETTNRLIGWAGKTLGEHPDQRRQLCEKPSLIPNAIEELLRFEPPAPAAARLVTRDLVLHGKTVPAGSVMMFLIGAANRDETRFSNGDAFDIHREFRPHLSFGHGVHVCIGAALARLEGRVALEEILKRFPDWEVDLENAELSSTSAVRGWDALPVLVGKRANRPVAAAAKAVADLTDVPLEGTWNLSVKGPTGPQPTVLVLSRNGDVYTGTQSGQGATSVITDFRREGNKVSWINHVTTPLKMKVEFNGEVNGFSMSGKVKAGFMGKYPFSGVKA